MTDESLVELDVGGKLFKTTTDTLRESEYLYNLAWGDWLEGSVETRKPIFIDRDGYLFGYVLLYLRTGDFSIEDHHLKNLKGEAEFYLLSNLSEKIDSMMEEVAKSKECIYELVDEESFKALSTINIDGLTIDKPFHRRAIGVNKHFLTRISCRTSVYNCPRKIYVHTKPDNCGYKCRNARSSYHEDYTTVEKNMYLVSTTK